jgi:hypothetical protein
MQAIRKLSLGILVAALMALGTPALAQRGDGHGHGRGRDHDRSERDHDRGARHGRGGHHRDSRIVVRATPPRAHVEVRTQPRVVYVQPAPPPPRYMRRPAAPRRDTVWVDGYWQWTGRGYVWSAGHWEVTRIGHRYVQPHWEKRGTTWVFTPGLWISVR